MSNSLPTPPNTSHRDKENHPPPPIPSSSTGTRVAWSQQNQYHLITSPIKLPPAASKAREPSKSILKKSQPLWPLPEIVEQREITPEPSDPLVDLHYLAGPVSRIIASDASLRDLIEAYSVISARLKSCLAGKRDIDASWPLFHPFRFHADAFVQAIIRDLERVFVDPEHNAGAAAQNESGRDVLSTCLPSPKMTPAKGKKKGMSGEQVKYARDLCTVSHAAIKMLGILFSSPSIYGAFTDEHISSILTHVLAIPIADEVPTPNARKTCALAISLLQVQRLPPAILAPAADRIAYALRRGIEGELGKEGKKGSVNDGLRAIHDLSTTQPGIFISPFADLLPCILDKLLAPTLVLRSQACHALGGFVYGLTSISTPCISPDISARVLRHITPHILPESTASPRKQPVSPQRDPVLLRTLRTTVQTPDPVHPAQGPVWALSVVASLLVLVGPAFFVGDLAQAFQHAFSGVLTLAMRHKKSSVRAVGCIVWRTLTWVHFHSIPFDAEEIKDQRFLANRKSFWDIVKSVVELGAGTAMVGAILANSPRAPTADALSIVYAMTLKGGQSCCDAIELLKRLAKPLPARYESELEWNPHKLLPQSLFCASPGLLTTDHRYLATAVKPVLEQCPQLEDIRPLTRAELADEQVFSHIMSIWRTAVESLVIEDDGKFPSDLLSVLDSVTRANIDELRTMGDRVLAEFAERMYSEIIHVLQSPGVNFCPPPEDNPEDPLRVSCRSNVSLKLSAMRELWNVIREAFPWELLNNVCRQFIAALRKVEEDFVWNVDASDDLREEWGALCAEILFVWDDGSTQTFWQQMKGSANERGVVWRSFMKAWMADAGGWDVTVSLLAVPFAHAAAWDMSKEDLDVWEGALKYAVDQGCDQGIDAVFVLNQAACNIERHHLLDLDFTSPTRVADFLLSAFAEVGPQEAPSDIFDLVNDILLTSYPPEPRQKVISLWTIRALTQAIDVCPIQFTVDMLEVLQEGLNVWIVDYSDVLTDEEYAFDILPLYQTILLVIQTAKPSAQSLYTLDQLIQSPFQRPGSKFSPAEAAFKDFWQTSYAGFVEPDDGWPEGIRACLELLDLSSLETCTANQTSNSVSSHTDEQVFEKVDDDEDAAYDADVSFDSTLDAEESTAPPSILKVDHTNGERTLESTPPRSGTPTATSHLLEIPVTPKLSQLATLPSTPPRPGKASCTSTPANLQFLLQSPASPSASPSRRRSVVRAPRSRNVSGSSSKGAAIEDKENMAPTSVAVTGCVGATSLPLSSLLGKRRVQDDGTPSKAAKKPKSDAVSPVAPQQNGLVDHIGRDSHNKFGPTATLVAQPGLAIPSPVQHSSKAAAAVGLTDPFAVESVPEPGPERNMPGQSTRSPKSKKRKRIFLMAVEVPTVAEVRKRWIREDSLSRKEPERGLSCAMEWRATRRTRSTPTVFGDVPLHSGQQEAGSSKRRKTEHDSAKPKGIIRASSLVLARRQEPSFIGSDDSIVLEDGSDGIPSSDPPSDEGQYLGALTPHHLISPALRRVAVTDSDYDPPSDDSVPASPSRERVVRRLERTESQSRFLSVVTN